MDSGDTHDDNLPSLTIHYAQHVAEGVELPSWAAGFFSSAELAVLGAIRDTANKSTNNTCTLNIREIGRLVDVHPRTVARAITVAIAAGVIERDGNNLVNSGIY